MAQIKADYTVSLRPHWSFWLLGGVWVASLILFVLWWHFVAWDDTLNEIAPNNPPAQLFSVAV